MTDRQHLEPPEDGAEDSFDNISLADSDPGMLKSSAVMAVGTVLSRITGVFRDIAIVAAIGFGTLADAYTLGNTLPNTVYLLVVGGALGAVFVPQLIRHLKEDPDRGDEYANRLLTLTAMVLIVVAVAAVIAAPWIVRLYTPDNYSANQVAVATAFARLCLPQIFFYGLYTMLAQVLNSRRHFAMPMFAPIINNLVVITVAGAFLIVAGDATTVDSITPGELTLLGLGTTLGVVLQAVVLIPVLARVSYRYRPRFNFRGYGLTKTAGLAGWTVAMVLANQVALLVSARLASAANVEAAQAGVVEQGLTTFEKAYLVFALPNSVITISLVTALLPRLSASAAEGNLRKVANQLTDGARLVSALIVPSAAVLVAFGPAITTLVFSYGAGAGAAASYTGTVVSAFALGLLPFSLFYLLIRGWYALEDTRTPFLVTVVFNALLIAFSIWLYQLAPAQVKVVSLGLAESVAYWIALVVAWWWLRRRLGGLNTGSTAGTIARMVVAGAIAGGVGFAAGLGVRYVHEQMTGTPLAPGEVGGPVWAAITLVVGGAVTLVVYLLVCKAFRVRELDNAVTLVRDRVPVLRKRGPSDD